MSEENKRETKELEVGNHKLVVHTYVTGREMRNIESAMMDKLELSQKGDEQKITGFKGSMIADRQDMQIEAVVVSIDGTTENVVDAILDLPATESEQIMDYIKSLTEPKNEEADS